MKKYRIMCIIAEYLYKLRNYIKRRLFSKKISESLLNNIEGVSEYNIPKEWFFTKKTKGISGVARLKNAEHFLELCMESHLPYLDELILVDNQSSDKTGEICEKLKKKYPDKIRFFTYPFHVFPPSHKNKNIPSNSLHSLAYYYNRCFSKASYSHVMKVDDDNYLLIEKWNKIRKSALRNNKYNVYFGINLFKNKEGKFGTYVGHEYLGMFGDHGIYPVSPYNYYIQGEECEVFLHNLRLKKHGFSLFHLKFLKPDFGFHNTHDKNIIKKYKPDNSDFIELTGEYLNQLKKSKIDILLESILDKKKG